MKSSTLKLSRLLLAACAAAGLGSGVGLRAQAAPFAPSAPASQEQSKDKPKEAGVKISDGERKAVKKINDAKDFNGKFQAAKEFVQKYPNSPLRQDVAFQIAKAVIEVTDPAQRIAHAESFLNTFTNAGETSILYPALIAAYTDANRVGDAFNAAQTLLETSPNEAFVLYRLALAGTNEAQRGNNKFAQQSAEYGRRAIQLIESNQRPASIDEAEWNSSRNLWLSQLYQSTALLALMSNKAAEALPSLQKAASLNPTDPVTFRLLGDVKDDEYKALVNQYKVASAGAAQDAARKKAEAKLDEVIEMYARSLAQAEGKEQYKPLYDQTRQALETYYKFRHNNSTAGLQEMVNKFKTAPGPQPQP